MDDHLEAICAKVHETWIAAHQANGVTSRPASQTGEERMVPYEELSEDVKEYVRARVRPILTEIAALGYKLRKR
jgi:hypothetical protein